MHDNFKEEEKSDFMTWEELIKLLSYSKSADEIKAKLDAECKRMCIGSPKFKYGEKVLFYYDTGKEKIEHYGRIEIIDTYGTLGQSKEVSYDIMGLDERCLFKHVVESDVYKFHEGMN